MCLLKECKWPCPQNCGPILQRKPLFGRFGQRLEEFHAGKRACQRRSVDREIWVSSLTWEAQCIELRRTTGDGTRLKEVENGETALTTGSADDMMKNERAMPYVVACQCQM